MEFPHLIVLLFITLVSGDELVYKCPDNFAICECPGNAKPSSENPSAATPFIFYCPPTKTQIDQKFTVTYDMNSLHVEMECYAEHLDYEDGLLESFNFPQVDVVKFTRCPLPNGSYAGLLEGLDVNRIRIVLRAEVHVIPSTLFHNLSHVTELFIDGRLVAIENGTFHDMPHLVTLSLSQNNFGQLPADFFHDMPQMVNLNVDFNNIESLPKGTFDNLPNLRNLSLSNNPLHNLEDGIFHKLLNLQSVWISSSRLGSVGADLFDNLTKLEFVDLRYNELNVIPAGLFRTNRELRTLLLTKNSIGEMPEELFRNNVNLHRLELDYNNLSLIPENLFASLRHLDVVILSNNKLGSLPEKIFAGNLALTEIDLRVNQLSSLPGDLFKTLTQLKTVRLSNNRLASVPRLVFSSLPTLEFLDLGDNSITDVDTLAFEHSDNITFLDLSHNELEWTTRQPFPLPTKIERVHLSHNNITSVPEAWTASNALLNLDLSYNRIQSVNAPQLTFHSERVTVDLQYNQIKTINLQNFEKYLVPMTEPPDVPSTTAVPTIMIENNPIDCDCNLMTFVRFLKKRNPKGLPFRFEAKNLKCRYAHDTLLSDQYVSAVNENFLYCLETDRCDDKCTCKYNNFATVIVDCSLRLQANITTTVPPNTTKLFLSHNNITSITTLADPVWNHVTEVRLDANAIHSIDTPVTLPSQLELLDLRNNRIATMPLWLMTEVSLRDNLSLALAGNQWRCNCDTVDFSKWLSGLTKGEVQDRNGVRCVDGRYRGEKLANLNATALCSHQRASPAGPILVTAFTTLILFGLAIFLFTIVSRNRYKIKMWFYRHGWCLWLRTPDDIEAGHPL